MRPLFLYFAAHLSSCCEAKLNTDVDLNKLFLPLILSPHTAPSQRGLWQLREPHNLISSPLPPAVCFIFLLAKVSYKDLRKTSTFLPFHSLFSPGGLLVAVFKSRGRRKSWPAWYCIRLMRADMRWFCLLHTTLWNLQIWLHGPSTNANPIHSFLSYVTPLTHWPLQHRLL